MKPQRTNELILADYANIPFDPARGFHCWGLVQAVYRDRTGYNLQSFHYTSPDENASLIEAIAKQLPTCRPQDLAVFVIRESQTTTGIISHNDAIFMGCTGARIISWDAIARTFNPTCYDPRSLAICV